MPVNGDEKVRILVEEGLIKAAVAAPRALKSCREACEEAPLKKLPLKKQRKKLQPRKPRRSAAEEAPAEESSAEEAC